MRLGAVAVAGGVLLAGCATTVPGAGQVVPGSSPAVATPPAISGSASTSAPVPPSARARTSTSAAGSARPPAGIPSSRAQVTSTCAPVFFGVPGSGQGLEHPPPVGVPSGVSRTDAHAYGTAIGLVKTLLVKLAGHRLASTHAIDYPATALQKWFSSDGRPTNLDASEARGTSTLVNQITAAEQGRCAGRPVLLAGYSQGAEVVIRAVNALAPSQRAGVVVALFGNPSYEPGQAGDYPGNVPGRGVRPSLTGSGYSLPLDVRGRTIDICAPGDPVCGMSPAAHTDADKLAYLVGNANVHARAYAFDHPSYANRAAHYLWQHR